MNTCHNIFLQLCRVLIELPYGAFDISLGEYWLRCANIYFTLIKFSDSVIKQ